MSEKKDSILVQYSQAILNLALALGSFSVLFYITGYLFFSEYYATLGVGTEYLDFTSYDYIIMGVLINFLLLIIIPNFISDIQEIVEVKKIKGEIKNIKMDLSKLGKLNKGSHSIEHTGFKADKLEKQILHSGLKQAIYFFIIVVILNTIFVLVCYLALHNINFVYFGLINYIFMGGSFILVLGVNFLLRAKKIVNTMLFVIPVLLVVWVGLVPTISGHLFAKKSIKFNSFPRYTIYLEEASSKIFSDSGDPIKNANLLLYGKNTYIFSFNDKINIINENNILVLEKE